MKEQNCVGLSSSNALHDQMIKDMLKRDMEVLRAHNSVASLSVHGSRTDVGQLTLPHRPVVCGDNENKKATVPLKVL